MSFNYSFIELSSSGCYFVDTFDTGIQYIWIRATAKLHVTRYCNIVWWYAIVSWRRCTIEKLLRSFHCKRVKKLKWFWHVLSGTISFVIIIINFLSVFCFFFLSPFFSLQYVSVWCICVCIFYSSFLIKLNCWNKLQEFRLTFQRLTQPTMVSIHSTTSLSLFLSF